MSRRSTSFLIVGAAAWVALVVAGFAALQRYAAGAGLQRVPDAAAVAWLQQLRRPDRPLVVMAIHARCPCTDASLGELADFLARAHGGCDALLLRYVPAGAPAADWPAGVEVRELGGVPVPLRADPDGRIAAHLGAFTSGSIVLLDSTGAVRFHGGLTLARGHRGRSPVQDTMLALVAGDPAKDAVVRLTTAPVYGCALATEEEQPEICQ